MRSLKSCIAGNFDRTTNPHLHPNPTDFAHEIRIIRMRILAGSVTSLKGIPPRLPGTGGSTSDLDELGFNVITQPEAQLTDQKRTTTQTQCRSIRFTDTYHQHVESLK